MWTFHFSRSIHGGALYTSNAMGFGWILVIVALAALTTIAVLWER